MEEFYENAFFLRLAKLIIQVIRQAKKAENIFQTKRRIWHSNEEMCKGGRRWGNPGERSEYGKGCCKKGTVKRAL